VLAVWEEADRLRFDAQNLTPWPITLTLRVTPTNLAQRGGARGNVTTVTVPPASRTALLSYARRDAERKARYRFYYEWDFGATDIVHDDDYVYRLPYADGERYRVLQGFGSRFSHTGNEHYTVDFDMPRGTAVHAAREGVVVDVVEQHGEGCWEDRCRNKANYIVVLHNDGSTGEYYHLLRDRALVTVGERVARGQRIGLSGNSGHSTMPHLHFGVYEVIEWGATRSLKVRFDSSEGELDSPARGHAYQARSRTAAP
jgi:murein DD-endopeptidase MepM/ murein hydrolase activator NlpD